MNKMKSVLEGVYSDPDLRKSVVPLFIGNPGLGKTVIISDFAKEKGVNLVELITSQRNPFEISGLGMPDKDTKRMSFWDFDTLLDMKDGDILFFDEILNGNPTVLNACLTLLENRVMISGHKLPDIMIVAAANPQGQVPLPPQVKERFIWYPVSFDYKMWSKYMKMKYKMHSSVLLKLKKLIDDEKFTGQNNFMTPRSIDKNTSMIIKGVPTPYENILLPILESLMENKLKSAVDLPNGNKLEPGEQIKWIDIHKKSY